MTGEEDPWRELEETAMGFLAAVERRGADVLKAPGATHTAPRLVHTVTSLAALVMDGRGARQSELGGLLRHKNGQLRQVTHELRRPVGLINGHVSMALSGDFGSVPEPLLVMLHTMKNAVSEMQQLCDLLAEAARLEDPQEALRREHTPIGHLVRDAIHAVEQDARERHVTLERRLPDPDVTIHVDPRQLRIAVVNLLTNAVRHTPEGTAVEIAVQAQEGAVVIGVSDQGPGVEQAERERIFEAWRRGSIATGPGLGLGLSIARDLVKLHGGRLHLTGQPGQGATFTIWLPR